MVLGEPEPLEAAQPVGVLGEDDALVERLGDRLSAADDGEVKEGERVHTPFLSDVHGRAADGAR